MPLTIHASRDFAKRYKCAMGLPGEKVSETGKPDSWSAHFVRISRMPMVIMMHDATLWSVIIPVTGVTTLPKFLALFLGRVTEVWEALGASFDPANQDVTFLPRSNRPLIGSMNDAVSMMHFAGLLAIEEKKPLDWGEIEDRLNRTPYKAIGRARPRDLMADLLKTDGCRQNRLDKNRPADTGTPSRHSRTSS